MSTVESRDGIVADLLSVLLVFVVEVVEEVLRIGHAVGDLDGRREGVGRSSLAENVERTRQRERRDADGLEHVDRTLIIYDDRSVERLYLLWLHFDGLVDRRRRLCDFGILAGEAYKAYRSGCNGCNASQRCAGEACVHDVLPLWTNLQF